MGPAFPAAFFGQPVRIPGIIPVFSMLQFIILPRKRDFFAEYPPHGSIKPSGGNTHVVKAIAQNKATEHNKHHTDRSQAKSPELRSKQPDQQQRDHHRTTKQQCHDYPHPKPPVFVGRPHVTAVFKYATDIR